MLDDQGFSLMRWRSPTPQPVSDSQRSGTLNTAGSVLLGLTVTIKNKQTNICSLLEEVGLTS